MNKEIVTQEELDSSLNEAQREAFIYIKIKIGFYSEILSDSINIDEIDNSFLKMIHKRVLKIKPDIHTFYNKFNSSKLYTSLSEINKFALGFLCGMEFKTVEMKLMSEKIKRQENIDSGLDLNIEDSHECAYNAGYLAGQSKGNNKKKDTLDEEKYNK